MEQKTVIEMKQLNCKIGKQYLLKEINWTIADGEHWILFGLNGSGKITLLSILAGYQQQTSGELKVFGEAYCAENLIRNRRKIGLVSSSYFDRCYQDESVLEIVLSGVLGTLGLDFDLTDADVKRAKQLLGRLGLAEKINQSYGTMSKGERECVLIARALLAEPEILILDEPCSGLDVLARDNMLHTVEQLAESRETTMIYVTHYMEEILPCFEHAVLLRQGRIYQNGQSQTVFSEADDAGEPILTQLQERLCGLYRRENLVLFEGLMDRAYRAKHLTETTVKGYESWLNEEIRQLEDEPVVMEQFEKDFFDILYTDGTVTKRYCNAECRKVYQKKAELEKRHMLVTPVLQKHYWHSYEETVKDIRQMFEQDLDRAYDSVYFAYLKQFDGLAACVPEKAFQEWSSKNREKIRQWRRQVRSTRFIGA